nr:hypothetical protein [Tanacetum cinerariifolium]
CFNCGDFSHLAKDCRRMVQRETNRSQNYTYKSFTHRFAGHRPNEAHMRPPLRSSGPRPHGNSMRPSFRPAGHRPNEAHMRPPLRSSGPRPHGNSKRPLFRPTGHRPYGPSMNPKRPTMNGARP